MSGGSRRKRKGNKAWDDVINASSSQDGNPFDLLKMELPDEQREIYKKMRGEVMRMMGAERERDVDAVIVAVYVSVTTVILMRPFPAVI